MRQLDRDLYAADAVTQQRLWGVLERYSTWLDQLPATDRGRIEAAGNPEQRLRLIQELRDKQWLAYLPAETRKALDTELRGSSEQQRSVIMLKYKNQERQRRHHHGREPGRHKPGPKDKGGRPPGPDKE